MVSGGQYNPKLLSRRLFSLLADVLGEGEDADADVDEVIVPSRKWSGREPGEAGSVLRECRLDLVVDE